jgi:LDH2 family malate/lactate/ureidoglycolate dehydrogenase
MAIEKIDGPRVAAGALEPFVAGLLAAGGADLPRATAVARAVVDASARGVDTHGVRLAPWYVEAARSRVVKPKPKVTFRRKAPSVGHVDGDLGFGHLASYRAVEEGCAIAAETGVAAITVGRSSHHGATGVYALAAAREGFACLAVTHADSIVVPFSGRKAFFGTNPLAFAVPVRKGEPMVLDMATSAVPFNRVMLRRATGKPLPPEVAMDKRGRMTTDPNRAIAVMPVGGADFGYKGAGLAAMIDVLCAPFTGMGHGATLKPPIPGMQPVGIGHFFLVMQPSTFQALSLFDRRLADFLADLRSQEARRGERVLAPGDLEVEEAKLRARLGVPVDRKTWADFERLAGEFGIAMPETMAPPRRPRRKAT